MSQRRRTEYLHEPPRVAYLRDANGTWVGIEVVRAARWSERLLELPDPELADLRLVIAPRGAVVPASLPGWLIVRRDDEETVRAPMRPSGELPTVFGASEDANLAVGRAVAAIEVSWPASPWYRGPGPLPEAYLDAGMRAMCPPHPPCPATPDMRDLLLAYLGERHSPLSRLVTETDEGLARLLRVYWATPEAFAADVLRERIRDDGGRHLVQLTDFLEAAEVADDVPSLQPLAAERQALLARLAPIRYFTAAADHDRAAALTLEWRVRYQEAYVAHYQAVREETRAVLASTAIAAGYLDELEAVNRSQRPVGQDAARRLRAALQTLVSLPSEPDPLMAVTAGVVLGRVPSALPAARVAASAVLAAVSVQRARARRMGDLAARG